MTNTKDIIMKLKEVREEKGYSYGDILTMMEENGDYLSKSTISRVFSDGSEEMSFRYEETIRPIANALLDIDNLEDDDSMDVQAMKMLLKYKSQYISDLEQKIKKLEDNLENEKIKFENALHKEKIKYHEKIDKERAQFNRSIEFLKEQVAYKDKRMDLLLDSVQEKDKLHKEMLEKLLKCAKCDKHED